MPQNQASTTASPPPEIADEPAFLPPPPPTSDPLDPETTTVQPPGPETDEGASRGPGADGWADEGDEEELLEEPPTTTSRGGRSRASSPSAEARAAFAETIGGLVGLASLGVHYARRAPGDLWIADPEDVDAIASPLARIAERHSPVALSEASDLVDGIQVALGTTGYVVKNIHAEAEERAARAAPPPPSADQEPTPWSPDSPPLS